MLHRVSWAALTIAMAVGCASGPAGAVVDAYPSPGTRVASPHTQLSFRDVAPGAIHWISVTGSRSGVHSGRLVVHSDGRGESFLPDKPFAQGETVTVRTSLPIHRGRLGAYGIRIATQGPPLRPLPHAPPLLLHGAGLQYFHSRHDLHPATLTASAAHGPTAPGDLFVGLFSAPFQVGPGQQGPAIFDTNGRLIWFNPVPTGQVALDVRVQRYQGQPVLTWWQGFVNVGGWASARAQIFDTSYRQIAHGVGRQRLQGRPARVQAHLARHGAGRGREPRSSATSRRSHGAKRRGRARLGRAGDRREDRPGALRVAQPRPRRGPRLVQRRAGRRRPRRTTTSTSTRSKRRPTAIC